MKKEFKEGIRDGIPIGLGYLAVSFSLGVAARSAGLTAFQGFIASLLNNASAGEYAGFTVIAANASYLEMALMTLVANARYLLMSCACGTALGVTAGNMLPLRVVSALSVALFGMFLAVIIPPARKNRTVAIFVLISFLASFAAANLPYVSQLSSGTRTIILTILISAAAATLFPVKEEEEAIV